MDKIFPKLGFSEKSKGYFNLFLAAALLVGGFFVSTNTVLAASSSNITTNAITDLTPDNATQGATNVPILSFQITTGTSTGEKFKSMVVHYTGTNKADIAHVYLYQESGSIPGSSFDVSSDTLRDTGSAINSSGNSTLDPPDINLATSTSYKFYIVVDIDSGATINNSVDFKIEADKITFNSGTWPSAADITLNGWDPAGATTIIPSITTDEVAQAGPTSVLQGALKVPIISFTLSNTDTTDKFKQVIAHYTGTNKADIAHVYLYKESGPIAGSSFDAAADILIDTGSSINSSNNTTLNPTDFSFTQTKLYIVVDVEAAATLGNVIDFSIEENKITLTSQDWPPASEITAGTWNPSGNTLIKTDQTITVTTPAPASAVYNSTFPVAATSSSGLEVTITTSDGCTGGGSGTATITMTSGTTACIVHFNQAGNGSYNPAPEILETVSAQPKTTTASVTASDKTYDGTTTATIANCSLSDLVGSDVVSCSASSANFSDENVGNKIVTATGIALAEADASNYQLSSTTATTTANIIARPIVITADAKSKTYGDPDPALTYGITGTLVNPGDLTGDLNRDPGEDVGDYSINQNTLALTSNYALTYVPAIFSISPKATLTITADDQSITYGDPDPSFTFSYSGFKNGDDSSVIDTPPTCSVSGAHSDAGIYAIICSGGLDNNYEFSYNSGTLTVNKADQTITFDALADKNYGDADFDVNASSSSGLAISFIASGNCTVSGNTVHLTWVGSCNITAQQAGNTNYNAAADVLQSFNILDVTPPDIDTNPDMIVEATDSTGAIVNFSNPTSTDIIDGSIASVCSPASGSSFPFGVSTVSCSATDNAGNTATSTFKVTVQDTTPPTKPVANPAGGDYQSAVSVTLTSNDVDPDAIYYTTDGSDPNKSSALYVSGINIDSDITLKAIAYDKSGNASEIMTEVYSVAPVISDQASVNTQTSLTITWTTNNPATSRIIYDTTSHPDPLVGGAGSNYGYAYSTVEDSTKVTNHSVTISGLNAGSPYYYRTVSHGSPESVSAEQSVSTMPAEAGANAGGGGGGGGGGSSFLIMQLAEAQTQQNQQNQQTQPTGGAITQPAQTPVLPIGGGTTGGGNAGGGATPNPAAGGVAVATPTPVAPAVNVEPAVTVPTANQQANVGETVTNPNPPRPSLLANLYSILTLGTQNKIIGAFFWLLIGAVAIAFVIKRKNIKLG